MSYMYMHCFFKFLAEVTAFSNGMSSEHDGWVAASSMVGAAGRARVGGLTH